eukprot:769460-Alexandrium_andersonii.AAC.1
MGRRAQIATSGGHRRSPALGTYDAGNATRATELPRPSHALWCQHGPLHVDLQPNNRNFRGVRPGP